MTVQRPTSPRRELGAAVALCLVGGGVTLLASGRPWVRAVLLQPPLAKVATTSSGRTLVPVVAALGLVGLAGVVALLATRGTGRLATGVLLAVAGTGVVVASVGALLDVESRARPVVERRSGVPGSTASGIRATPWPGVSALGGLLLSAGGGITAIRGRRWTTLSARHEPPGPARAPDREEPARIWDALDRGEDPTRPPP